MMGLGDIMSTLGYTMSSLGFTMMSVGDIMRTLGVFSTLEDYHEYTGGIPTCLWGLS